MSTRYSDPHVLQAAVATVRLELRRFDFKERQRIIAELILSLSWEEGLRMARIPKLEFFEQLTGIKVAHLSGILSSLELMRVITIEETADGKYYMVNPDSANWQCAPRLARKTMIEALNMVREINGLEPHTEAKQNFKITSATIFLAANFSNSEKSLKKRTAEAAHLNEQIAVLQKRMAKNSERETPQFPGMAKLSHL